MVFAKKIKKQVGFTVIEISASVFIIALISGLLLVNYHSTNKRSELIMAAQKLASDIRLAQSYALGSKEFNGQVPQGGWGVFLSIGAPNISYIIFTDNDGNYIYNTGEESQTINLPSGITIDDIQAYYDFSWGDLSNLYIVFSPPDPTTYINRDYIKAKITLKEKTGNTIKTVEINSLGLVDVID